MRAVIFLIPIWAAPVDAQVVVDRTLDADGSNQLQMIANEVWDIVRDLFGKAPPLNLPIRCHFDPSRPITSLDNWTRPTATMIGITVTGAHWSQFAYQLSHELGHVMIDPRRSNGIIETICVALSYEVLDQLSAKFGSGSPRSNRVLSAYGENFKNYRQDDERAAISRFPPEIKVAFERKNWLELRRYLERHRSEQEQLTQAEIQAPHGRDIQTLGAIALRSAPIAWKDLWDLGACTSPPPDKLPSFLDAPINSGCIQRLSPMLCRVGRGCNEVIGK
ncbi:MAG TPA: hypothetical protein VNU44_14190 [Bryobacteraceae bacterium]|nr:hypothetical protein [Bryobacteraceae bacterium]